MTERFPDERYGAQSFRLQRSGGDDVSEHDREFHRRAVEIGERRRAAELDRNLARIRKAKQIDAGALRVVAGAARQHEGER